CAGGVGGYGHRDRVGGGQGVLRDVGGGHTRRFVLGSVVKGESSTESGDHKNEDSGQDYPSLQTDRPPRYKPNPHSIGFPTNTLKSRSRLVNKMHPTRLGRALAF